MTGTVAVADWLRAGQRIVVSELRRGGWLRFGQFRWRDADLPAAVRAGAGTIAPLAGGLAVGHAEYGVFAALGSLPAGIVSLQGVTRTRVSAVVLAAVAVGAATFVGAAAAHTDRWLLVPAVVAVAYPAGLLVALGPRFSVVGLQAVVQLVVASALPLPPGEAAVRAAFAVAGGLWQGVLVVASWLVLPGGRERAAVAATYRELSRYAAALAAKDPHRRPGPPRPAPFPGSDVLSDPNPLLGAPLRLRLLQLLEEGERIRASLAALAGDAPPSSLLEQCARVLAGIADALEARRGRRRATAVLQRAVNAVEVPADVPWRWAGQALLGQVRGVLRVLGRLDDATLEPHAEPVAPTGDRGGPGTSLGAVVRSLRVNLGVSTEAGRHAARLAVIVGAGETVAAASSLPHGYWVVLTTAIVLKPDYTSTVYRGIQRAVGTVVGAGLGAVTALLLHVDTTALVVAVGLTITVSYVLLPVNYMMFAVFLTDFVVTFLVLLGEPAGATALARLAGTGIGGALAIGGYLLWPTWTAGTARQRLAQLVEAQAGYAAAVVRAYPAADAALAATLRSAQAAARRARFDAEAAVDRLADEPPRPPMTATLGYAVTGAMRRFAHAALTLHAALIERHPGGTTGGGVSTEQPGDGARPDSGGRHREPGPVTWTVRHSDPTGAACDDPRAVIDAFADAVVTVAAGIAASLRTLTPPPGGPPLRRLHTAVMAAVTPSRSRAGRRRQADAVAAPDAPAGGDTRHDDRACGRGDVLVAATDEFTDALDTVADALRRHVAAHGNDDGRDERPDR